MWFISDHKIVSCNRIARVANTNHGSATEVDAGPGIVARPS